MEETRQAQFDKLLELEKRLVEVSGMKKAAVRDYNDQIKEIKSEIKEVVAELGGE